MELEIRLAGCDPNVVVAIDHIGAPPPPPDTLPLTPHPLSHQTLSHAPPTPPAPPFPLPALLFPATQLVVQVADLQLTAKARVILAPLVGKIPGFGALSVSIIGYPYLDFSLVALSASAPGHLPASGHLPGRGKLASPPALFAAAFNPFPTSAPHLPRT